MEEQIKKRKKRNFIVGYSDETDREEKNRDEFLLKIIHIFKNYIGKDNAILNADLFYKVYGIEPTTISVFKREFMWNFLKKALSHLRSVNELYTHNDGYKTYVIHNWEEYAIVESRIDNTIKKLKNMKENAKDWVKREKWKDI